MASAQGAGPGGPISHRRSNAQAGAAYEVLSARRDQVEADLASAFHPRSLSITQSDDPSGRFSSSSHSAALDICECTIRRRIRAPPNSSTTTSRNPSSSSAVICGGRSHVLWRGLSTGRNAIPNPQRSRGLTPRPQRSLGFADASGWSLQG